MASAEPMGLPAPLSWRASLFLVTVYCLLWHAIERQKNDMADAEAICEAVSRATMRFVPTKTPEQQSCLMLHRARHLFIRQQTAVINSIRAYLPSSALSRRSSAKESRNCSMLLPTRATKRTSWWRPLFTESKLGVQL